jgi:hypothetical protein
MSGIKTNSGEALNRLWKVGAKHALYHKDGKFYMPLEYFPGVYFDPNGYLLFKTEAEYKSCKHLKIGKRVNVIGDLSCVPGYRKMR